MVSSGSKLSAWSPHLVPHLFPLLLSIRGEGWSLPNGRLKGIMACGQAVSSQGGNHHSRPRRVLDELALALLIHLRSPRRSTVSRSSMLRPHGRSHAAHGAILRRCPASQSLPLRSGCAYCIRIFFTWDRGRGPDRRPDPDRPNPQCCGWESVRTSTQGYHHVEPSGVPVIP